MRTISCPICTEDLQEDIVTTKCGHIFHDLCISQWLQSNRICPTCRGHATKKTLIKIFLNSADESFTSSQLPTSDFGPDAFEKCKRLNDQLKERITDLNSTIEGLKSENDDKDKINGALSTSKSALERELKNARSTAVNLRTKMKYMVEDAEKSRQLSERNLQLERELRALKGLQVVLEGSHSEYEELLANTSDSQTLARIMSGLKRDYTSLQRSKSEVQQHAEGLQRKLSFSRVTISNLKEELDNIKRDKHMMEKDLSTAERRNESLCKKIGEFEDRSMNNTNLINLNGSQGRRSMETPIHLNKRQRKEQSTPLLVEEDDSISFNQITREFEAELSRDDELDKLAAELGVDINMASTPSKPELPSKDVRENNLFTKVGYDGLGGTARIKKENNYPRSVFAKQLTKKNGSSSGNHGNLARSATLGNFFKKL